MPINIADAEDIFLEGRENVDEFMREFDAEFYAPIRETFEAALIRNLPPEVSAALRGMAPEAMQQMENKYGNQRQPTRPAP